MSEALLEALRAADPRRRHFDLRALWEAFARAHPADAEGPAARRTLAAHLDTLSVEGRVVLPASRSRCDRTAEPPLPSFVRVPAKAPRAAVRPLDPAWAPELRFARELTSPAQLEVVHAVQRFLKEGGRDRPRVPERERSLELFGDEKRLERLRRTQLFGPERLDLDLLRCFSVSPPVVWERFPSQSRVGVVLENHHTYWSFCEHARRTGCYVAVVYGAGNALCRGVESLVHVAAQASVDVFEYFGDVDAAGLRVARTASQLAEELGVRMVPSPFYCDLLKLPAVQGTVRPCAEEDVAWLPEALRDPVREATSRGHRWPQEYIGWEFLRAHHGPRG